MPALGAAHARRKPVLALVAALHLLILLGWQAECTGRQPHEAQSSMQWVWVLPRRAEPVAAAPPQPVRPAARPPPVPPALEPAPVTPAPEAPPPAATDAAPPDDPFALPPDAPPDLLAEARRAAGRIDRELRREQPRMPERAREPSPQQRFAARVAESVAPDKRGVEIVELITGDKSGDRIYRVNTALGSYCLRYPAPRRGIDAYGDGGPKIIQCPR